MNSPITGKIDRTIRDHLLITMGNTVLVAVSGGVDSVVLLHYLASRSDLRLSLVVVHLNHALRGTESDDDEQSVAVLANGYGVRFESRREDVATFAKVSGLSLEEAGREVRYRFFREVAQSVGADSVAVAHHRDDQAETVLLRLLRGSGPTGLRGMPYRSSDVLIIRPLLDVTRSEIEGYAAFHNLSFRTDSSNSDPSFLRNRIRLHLLPALAEYNPAISARLAETASIMAADETVLSTVVDRRWEEVCTHIADRVVMKASAVRSDHPGLRLRLYRRSLEQLNGNLRQISYRHLQAIDRLLIDGPPNGALNLPDAIIVVRSYDELTFTHRSAVLIDAPQEIIVTCTGMYPLHSGYSVSITSCKELSLPEESGRFNMLVNLDEFPFPWTIRGFLPGDRIAPRGMTGRKKVKDLFIDEKIPRPQRSLIPLFLSGEKLFWVGGLRKGRTAPPDSPDAGRVIVQLLEFPHDAAMLA